MIIKSAEYVISCVKRSQYPNSDFPEFIFVGRSNVGKSSFINAIVNRKNLAYTSSKPGKTLTLNFYKINNEFFFIDVPGYGYAQRSASMRQDFGKMMEEYFSAPVNLKKCFLIVDSRHDPTEDDILMYNYLKYLNIDIMVIATKCDKIPKTQLIKHKKRIIEVLNISKDEVHALIESYLQ